MRHILSTPILLALPGLAAAEAHHPDDPQNYNRALVHPEIVLNYAGDEVQTGWTLTYFNRAEPGQMFIESLKVTLPDGSTGTVRWTIEQRPNLPCYGPDATESWEVCADTITITEVPDGFAAFPDTATVPEHGHETIHIAPFVLG